MIGPDRGNRQCKEEKWAAQTGGSGKERTGRQQGDPDWNIRGAETLDWNIRRRSE